MSKLDWLRASIMGSNDGILSTSSIMVGMIAVGTSKHVVLMAGLASLLSGSFAMAAGEYVSVSAEKDSEQTIIEYEKDEIESNWDKETEELASIYEARGLSQELSEEVAEELMEYDALGSHVRDEFGITSHKESNPLIASFSSAVSFCIGSLIPILSILIPGNSLDNVIISTILSLIILGFISSKISDTSAIKPIKRILIFGCLSMLVNYLIPNL